MQICLLEYYMAKTWISIPGLGGIQRSNGHFKDLTAAILKMGPFLESNFGKLLVCF